MSGEHSGIVTMRFAGIEAGFLHDLVEQYRELAREGAASDPAVARLTPLAYRDDADAATEFASVTRDDLLTGRAAEAERVLADVAAARVSRNADDVDADVVIEVAPDAQIPWMRTLSGLRLVLAARLDIVEDGDEPTDDPRYGAYEWLGYRLELLMQALDV